MAFWIDLYNMTKEQSEELPEEQQIEWINLDIRQCRREKNRCSKIPLFLYKIQKMYEASTGESFQKLWELPECAMDGRVISRALKAIRQTGKFEENAEPIDLNRDIDNWSLADLELMDSCLKYSLRYEFLLIHYDEQAMWTNRNFNGIDAWEAYDGFFQECRSPVVDLLKMDYVLLPFAKFRNLGESEEYSLENVTDKVAQAEIVEVSDKLDGSMIQISNLGDSRFWNGCIVATSGSLYPSRSVQLKDVLFYLDKNKEFAELLNQEPRENTYLFEWIDANDAHIVRYDRNEFGLHLIGRRSHKSGGLWSVSHVRMIAEKHGIKSTELYDMDLGEVLAHRDVYKASEKEGYVLYADGFQVKIKCSDYIGIARLIQKAQSFNTVIKYVEENKVDDMLSILPEEYRVRVQDMINRICRFKSKMSELTERGFLRLPKGADRKAVMLFIENEIADPYGMLKNLIRAKYLGKPVEILAQKKGDTVQYITESKVKKYEEWFEEMGY